MSTVPNKILEKMNKGVSGSKEKIEKMNKGVSGAAESNHHACNHCLSTFNERKNLNKHMKI